jgi:hypothetical protein
MQGKGQCGGGIRMHPSVAREMVIRLAEIMAYKFKKSAETKRYERDLAFELFQPTTQDPPEC